MKLSECIAGLPALWLLGCMGMEAPGTSDHPPPAAERQATPVEEDRLVRGSFSRTLGVRNPEECAPLGFPLTMFLTDAFGPDAIVEDDATSISATECLHEQVVEAGADSWATLAYQTVCLGGGDSRLCGAQATRLCSIETMLHWAEQPGGGFAAADPIFHFNYTVFALSESARGAFYLRILEEAQTLLTESASVLREHAMGTRNCPDEDYEAIAATYAEGWKPYVSITGYP